MAYATILDYLLASFSATSSEGDSAIDAAAGDAEPPPSAQSRDGISETA
jgi:hypothetical protein